MRVSACAKCGIMQLDRTALLGVLTNFGGAAMDEKDNRETDNADDYLDIQVSRKQVFFIWLYFLIFLALIVAIGTWLVWSDTLSPGSIVSLFG